MNGHTMSRIYVQPPDHYRFAEFLDFAKEHRYNLEIATFAYAGVLDADWEKMLGEHQHQLSGFRGAVSLHGVFQDVFVHSSDSKIAEVSKERILRNLEIASLLEAKYIVFHGNFNPLIRGERYVNNWFERNANFWSEVLRKYNVTVLLENVWEPSPEIFRKLLDLVGSSRLKICFDTGHANIFSKVPFREWFDMLNPDIPYIHVNDNKGEVDSELIPGDGIINWHEFTDILEDYQNNPEIVLEVGTLEKTMQSLRYLQMQSIYPFHGAQKDN
jgi:sugar phosphate isomerase/epimerase